MNLKSPTLILGENKIIVQSLKQVFELFETECYVFETIPNEKEDNEQKKAAFIDVLIYEKPRLVLSTVNNPSQAIKQIHELRSRAEWAGKFIAIVGNQEQMEKLMNETSLFGEKGLHFIYSTIPGHGAVCQPLLIVELLQVINQIESMYWESWKDLAKKWDFPIKLQEIKKMLQENNLTDAQPQIQVVIARFNQFHWQEILPHGAYSELKIVEKLRNNLNLHDKSDYELIIHNIIDVLSKTYLRSYL